jgi:GT2 family glycosyltransferase
MHSVTVGFIPRERFSSAAESLESILRATDIPYQLIIVNCGTPPAIWAQLEQLIDGRDNVRVISTDYMLLPNQARNLVIREATTDYLCLIENDNIVESGWLTKLIDACEEHPADVAAPLLIEGRPGATKVHFDNALGAVVAVQTDEGEMFEVQPRTPTRKLMLEGRQTQEFMETHCLMFRRSVFDRIGELDETINTSEEVDLSMAVQHAGVRAVFEPACRIHYVLPTFPLPEDDRPYFMKKWDVEQARYTHAHLQKKWRLARFPQIMGFVAERFYRGSGRLMEWAQELEAVRREGGKTIIVGLEEFADAEVFEALDVLPFVEKDGQFWGAPEDDAAAIAELERLRRDKDAVLLVFLWEHYWELDHYKGFADYLASNYRRVINKEHFIAYDVSAPAAARSLAAGG